jgi:hypothetical protein
MANPNELWVASYSPAQGCFDACPLGEFLALGRTKILEVWDNQYIPFFVGSSEEAVQACDDLARVMVRRGAKVSESGMNIWPKKKPRLTSTEKPGTLPGIGADEAAYRRGVLETLDALRRYSATDDLESFELQQIQDFAKQRQNLPGDFDPGKLLLDWINDPGLETNAVTP